MLPALTPGGAVVVVVAPAVRSICAQHIRSAGCHISKSRDRMEPLTVGDDEVVVQPRVLGLRGGGRAVLAADIAQVR